MTGGPFVRTWCCGTRSCDAHTPDCPFRATPDNPIDYGGPAIMTTPTPPEFPAGTEFRVSWEMPPATVTAYDYEDRYGPGVWLRLSAEQWAALPWGPSANVTDDYEGALGQYRQLSAWADSHKQPIRNVKLEQRRPPEWTEVTGVAPAGPPNPAPHLAADWLGPLGPLPMGGDRYA